MTADDDEQIMTGPFRSTVQDERSQAMESALSEPRLSQLLEDLSLFGGELRRELHVETNEEISPCAILNTSTRVFWENALLNSMITGNVASVRLKSSSTLSIHKRPLG